MCVLSICVFICVTCFIHSSGLSLVFGQVGQTIDWNWTSQARGVFSYTCTFCVCVSVCVCVCVFVCCVCVMCLEYSVCVYLCVFNFSACYQVGLNSPSINKLDLSSKKSYVSVENMCMHLCACYRSSGHYMALSLRNHWRDSRRSSDKTNGLLPNNKLILYSEVNSSWLDVNYLLMHVNTCTHVYHYTHITYHTCTCIFTHNTHTRTYTKHTATHTQMIVVSNVMNQNHDVQQSQGPRV